MFFCYEVEEMKFTYYKSFEKVKAYAEDLIYKLLERDLEPEVIIGIIIKPKIIQEPIESLDCQVVISWKDSIDITKEVFDSWGEDLLNKVKDYIKDYKKEKENKNN